MTYDCHDKLEVYRRHGVREYVIWRVDDEAIDWRDLHDKDFLRRALPADGVHKSSMFPGLWLNVPALLDGDLESALRTLDQGLASDAHAEFVARLRGNS